MVFKYFKPEEFSCKCGCGFNEIDLNLVLRLDQIREALKKPLVIKSGCRCAKWNLQVGGKPNSDHLTGNAADVLAIHPHTRFVIIKAALFYGMNRIGIGPGFIHLAFNSSNPQEVIWLYS